MVVLKRWVEDPLLTLLVNIKGRQKIRMRESSLTVFSISHTKLREQIKYPSEYSAAERKIVSNILGFNFQSKTLKVLHLLSSRKQFYIYLQGYRPFDVKFCVAKKLICLA